MQRTASLAASLLLLVWALPATSQRSGRARPPVEIEEVTYAWRIVPVDAIQGHLVEGPFKEPGDVFYDPAADEVYVADMKNGLIGIYDPEGVPVFAFGSRAVLADPKSLDVAAEGSIFVLDADQGAIKSFNYRGVPQEPVRFPAPGGEGGFVKIADFTRDARGSWYVADAETPRVLVYEPDLSIRLSIPREDDLGELELVTGLAVSAEGLIAVIDYKATPVQVFDAEGRFVSGFGEREIGLDNFTAPVDVAFDEEGYLYVVDMLRHDVKVFAIDGTFQAIFGGWFGPQTRGRAPGEMLYPTGIAIAPGSRLYVAERFGNRVQIFERQPKEGAEELSAPEAESGD